MRLVVSALILMLALSGCVTDDAPEATDDGPVLVTDPTDYSYLENNTTTGRPHIHDYWGGETVKQVVDQTRYPFYNNDGGESSSWTVRFHPEDGTTVPQGTERLEVTVGWTDESPANSYGDMELWAKTANASEPRLVEEALGNGETFEMPLTYNESDLPHQTISAWEFQVRIRGSPDPYNFFSGSITLQVDAHRGLELRPFPAHPDQWEGRTGFVLLEESRDFFQVRYAGYTGMADQILRPDNGSLVPARTGHVEVTLEYENTFPQGGLALWFHGADTREDTRLEPESDDGSVATYTIEVTDAMVDGPYAEASLWEFRVGAPRPGDDKAPMFDGGFTLSAKVLKEG